MAEYVRLEDLEIAINKMTKDFETKLDLVLEAVGKQGDTPEYYTAVHEAAKGNPDALKKHLIGGNNGKQ